MIGVGEGDRLLLYTDGVSEARDGAGRFFPLAERTTRALARDGSVAGSAGPDRRTQKHLLDELVANLDAHVNGPMRDDVLLLLASMKLGPGGLANRGRTGSRAAWPARMLR